MAKLLDVSFWLQAFLLQFSHHSSAAFAPCYSAALLTGTYVACLDCGREFPYDWQDMKVVTSVEAARPPRARIGSTQCVGASVVLARASGSSTDYHEIVSTSPRSQSLSLKHCSNC